ncbi:MAG: molybdate ABC transporter substrate-binding protein [Pseudanabaenaceae cyanobacterium]|jgi:molybdate transport system substrate-binding protein
MSRSTTLNFFKLLGIGLLLSLITYGITLYLTTTEPKATTILVSAASSLQPVLTELTPLYERANPTVKINYKFAGSGTLSQQLLQGAKTDVFIAAAPEHVTVLGLENLLARHSKRNIATNRLALVVPTSSHFNDLTKLPINDFTDLSRDEVQRVTIGNPRFVAAGKYAREVLEKSGVWQKVESKLALAKDEKAILAAVENGDTDAGLIYLTDAKTSDLVIVVTVSPTSLHSPILYPAAVLQSSAAQEISRSYIDFLCSPSAQEILKKYSFEVPD